MPSQNTLKNTLKITMSGLLVAIGLIIPMFSPIKILIEPASFTLASHVAVFVAMFISPGVAVSVAAGTTIGFFFGGFPPVVVFRAATHIIFALAGSFYLHKFMKKNNSFLRLRIFSFCVAIVHALGELVVTSIFYFRGEPTHGFVMSILVLVGLGTVIHSIVDFEIANIISLPLKKQKIF